MYIFFSPNKSHFPAKYPRKAPAEIPIKYPNVVTMIANVILIFDSWVGLLDEKDLPKYAYEPTLNLVNFVRSKNIPVICFPRGIKNYKKYTEIVKPDAISIDCEVDPLKIKK